MNLDEATPFCRQWLAAWTGNQPERLLDFYADDCYYQDPGRPHGLRGHAELRPYLEKLLAANPAWVWEAVEILPTDAGFCCKWKASIPAGSQQVTAVGLDIVEVDQGRITRNEVYFDTAPLKR